MAKVLRITGAVGRCGHYQTPEVPDAPSLRDAVSATAATRDGFLAHFARPTTVAADAPAPTRLATSGVATVATSNAWAFTKGSR
jgi:hypothetical protein